jgi:guanine deaminase
MRVRRDVDDSIFMAQAISLAIENVRSGRGGPFAALVVKDGAVVASGTNLVTSAKDPTAHAEIVAIREACRALDTFQLTGCTIYTTCEPCPMCMGAMYWAHPARICFGATQAEAAEAGFDDAYIYEELRRSPAERAIPMVQIARQEALGPFHEWQRKTDKIRY